MLEKIKIKSRLLLSFGILIVLMIGGGAFAVYESNKLADLTAMLYRHPYAVSTTMRDIQIGIIKIHRSMKDVALSRNNTMLESASKKVNEYEQKVLQNFDLIFERFLGDMSNVQAALDAFTQWKPIRDEVIMLQQEGRTDEAAAITKGKGAAHVALIEEKVIFLLDFADNKADSFMAGAQKTKQSTLIALISVFSAATFFALFIAILLSRSITIPLKVGVEFANRIASKDLSVDLDRKYIVRKDEIGELSVALSEMQNSLKGMMGEMNTGMSSLASSATELLTISEEMSKGAAMTTEKAGTVAAASEELNANATSVAAGMEQSSTNLDSVASATEEMTATIGQIAQNTESARSITEKAVDQSKQVTALMDILGESANEIGKVTETIASISDQTNLLALNATIEAARAGAAGRGFAVVASEIKDLAKQTADATEDIKNKINGIQSSTNNSIVDIKKITEIIQSVNDYVTTIASAVEEQSITTKDISDNMGQASSAVQDASERTAQNSTVSQDIAKEIADVSSSADEMSAASNQVAGSAKELSALSERLKAMVDTYKL